MKNIVVKKSNKLVGITMLFCILIPIFLMLLVKNSFTCNVNDIGVLGARDINLIEDNNCGQVNIFSAAGKAVMSSFSTDYSQSPKNRKYNIQLALKSLNNVVVKAGEEFSFNQVVGARTEERGYKKALVIFKGSYVEGVGGGVCQVSSTLYNAWLLAGLDAVSVKAHTLPAAYVDLSRDATVSEYIDMKLKNTADSDITIKTEYNDSKITIKILGKAKEYEYRLISQKLETIPYDEDIIMIDEQGEDEYFIGKDGYVSRLIICIMKDGKIILKRELRKDYYKPQNSVKIIRKSTLN